MSSQHLIGQIMYQRQPEAEVTKMTFGGDKQRRKIFERAPLDYELRLTQRDQAILLAIASHRCLTSEQITRKFFQPSVEHKLTKWNIDKQQAQDLIKQKSASYLDEITELLKWLLQIKKVRLARRLTASAHKKLQAWLRELETRDPQEYAELEVYLNSTGSSPSAWLLSAIQHGLTPPAAFFARPDANRQRISGACTQRLRLLFDAGYLEKIEQASRLSQGRLATVYLLSKKSRDYLAELLNQKPQEVYRLELVNISHATLPHFLKCNDIRIAITLDAERLGFEIIRWDDDVSLRRLHQRPSERVTVTFQGKEVTFGVVPDGYFWLLAGHRGQGHFWVECDLDTVVARYSQDGGKDWRRKVLGIGEYYKTRYSEAYPQAQKSLRILVVTNNQTRLNLLRSVTQEAAPSGAHRYWFTTFPRLMSGSPLTEPIWERADLDGCLHAIV